MRKVQVVVAAALAVGGLLAALPASAAPLSGGSPVFESSSTIQFAASRHLKRWYYDQHRHGPRFTYRHGGYRYNYGGYWYSRPWWDEPFIGVGVGSYYDPGYSIYDDPGYDDPGYAVADPGYGDDEEADVDESDPHVMACMNRYRTYDIGSDTFMGSDGRRHRCRVY